MVLCRERRRSVDLLNQQSCALNPFPATENADRAPVRPHIERALWRSRTASEMHPTYLARPLRGLAAVRTRRTAVLACVAPAVESVLCPGEEGAE